MLAGLAFCEMLSQYVRAAIHGVLRGSPGWSAAVCDPNPHRPFARSRKYVVSQARKRHINVNFFVLLVPVFTGFVPGTHPVCPWDKSGEKLGQTQEFSSFYTVEARFHPVCPWDNPGDEGRRRKFIERA